MIIGLREQCSGDLQVGFGKVAIRLRLVDVETRHCVTGGAQPLEFPVERGQVDLRPIHARGLLGPRKGKFACVEPRHDRSGLDRRARLGHPLQPARDRCREIGRGARTDDAGRVHRRRQFPDLGTGHPHRRGSLLLRRRRGGTEQEHRTDTGSAQHAAAVANERPDSECRWS